MGNKFNLGTYVSFVIANEMQEGHVVGHIKDDVLITRGDDSVVRIPREDVKELRNFPLRYKEGKIVNVTKEMVFDSCHNLLDYEGACANLHGHTYKIQVTFSGTCDEKGFVLDFKDVKRIMKELVVDRADHSYLNDLFDFNTTAENMVIFYYDLIELALKSLYNGRVKIESVRLWETPTSFAEYKGEVK